MMANSLNRGIGQPVESAVGLGRVKTLLQGQLVPLGRIG